jgi:RimJ/RimL family protein N-acetyltransferase
VGWLIDTPWQGRGLATEGGAASIRYAFEHLGFERIVSICTPENAPSRRLMARLGLPRIRDLDDPELGIRLWLHALDRAGLPP